jgi:hypothetical protein
MINFDRKLDKIGIVPSGGKKGRIQSGFTDPLCGFQDAFTEILRHLCKMNISRTCDKAGRTICINQYPE